MIDNARPLYCREDVWLYCQVVIGGRAFVLAYPDVSTLLDYLALLRR